MQGVRDRTISEIDGRSANDAARKVHAQARPTVAVEKREPEFTFIIIHPTLADACDRPVTHRCREETAPETPLLGNIRSS